MGSLQTIAQISFDYTVDRCFNAFKFNLAMAKFNAELVAALVQICSQLDNGLPDNLVADKDTPKLITSISPSVVFEDPGDGTVDISSCGFSAPPAVQLTAGPGVHDLQLISSSTSEVVVRATDAAGQPLTGNFPVHLFLCGEAT